MSRKIVFINQATGYITIDIINSFSEKFDKVALIAGSIRIQDIELDEKVNWSRIRKYDRGNPSKKLISWIIGTFQIFFQLLFRFRKYEVFYITIPPLAYLLSLVLPNKFSVLIFDVYPDVLKIFNISESSIIYRLWGKINRKLFKKAYRIFTISEAMAGLLTAYVSRDQIKVIPLWTGLKNAKSISKSENYWLTNLGLENKFVVQYSGNIGYTHNVEILVELAIRLKDVNEIHFLLIGRGERYQHISSLIEEYQLVNITLLPFQPDDVLIYSLAAADLGVVLLDERTAHVSLPSKIYNLQAVYVPILGISPLDSALDKHLKKYKNGQCFQQSDFNGIIAFILESVNSSSRNQTLSENSGKAAIFFKKENAEIFCKSYLDL